MRSFFLLQLLLVLSVECLVKGSVTTGMSGTVTAASGGADLQNIVVGFYQGTTNKGYAKTNVNGQYQSATLAAGSYTVRFSDATQVYITQWYNNEPTQAAATSVTVTAGSVTPNINAALVKNGIITGTVTSVATNNPISGIDVLLFQGSEITYTVTDASGDYTFFLPAGTYNIRFSDASKAYLSQWYNDKPTQTSSTSVVVTTGATTPNINAKLVPNVPPAVSGVSPATGLTTGGTSVIITGHDFTGATGVKFGTSSATSLTVDSNTQITATSPFHIAGAVGVTVTTPGGTSTVTGSNVFQHFTYVSGIFGTVQDTSSNTLANIEITLFAGSSEVEYAVTDSNGDYGLRAAAATDYTIRFSDPTHTFITQWYLSASTQASATPVTVVASQTTTATTVQLTANGILSGTVTASGIGALAGIEVTLYQGTTETYTTTSGTGTYSFNVPAGSNYLLRFSDPAHTYTTQWYNGQSSKATANAVTVASGSTTTADAVLA